jgi:hypothetical protein
MEVLTICFAISNSAIFLKILLSAVLLPRCGTYLEPWFLIPMMPSCFA